MRNYSHTQLIVPEMAARAGLQSYMLRDWEMLNELPGTQLKCTSLNESNKALVQKASDAAGRALAYSGNKFAFLTRKETEFEAIRREIGSPRGELESTPMAG